MSMQLLAGVAGVGIFAVIVIFFYNRFVRRRYYNAAVLSYNVATGVFPANLVASAFSYGSEVFFELGESKEAREPVKIAFK